MKTIFITIAIVALFGLNSCQRNNGYQPKEEFCWECSGWVVYEDGRSGTFIAPLCDYTEEEINNYMEEWILVEEKPLVPNDVPIVDQEIACTKL